MTRANSVDLGYGDRCWFPELVPGKDSAKHLQIRPYWQMLGWSLIQSARRIVANEAPQTKVSVALSCRATGCSATIRALSAPEAAPALALKLHLALFLNLSIAGLLLLGLTVLLHERFVLPKRFTPACNQLLRIRNDDIPASAAIVPSLHDQRLQITDRCAYFVYVARSGDNSLCTLQSRPGRIQLCELLAMRLEFLPEL